MTKGRLAVKLTGRDHGVCVVLGKKKDRVEVMGPRVRKRLVNPAHLEPLPETMELKGKEEEDIIKELAEKDKEFKETELGFIPRTVLEARLGR